MTIMSDKPGWRQAGLILALLLAMLATFSAAADELDVPFQVPDESTIPAGHPRELILRGRTIATHTERELPDNVGNRLRCANCHLKVGTVPYAAPWVGVIYRYPRYSSRSDRETDLQDRINGCLQRSMNGKKLERDSPPMQAMVAYMTWLSSELPVGAAVEGQGIPTLANPEVPSRERGRTLYKDRCSVCHGEDGQGQLDASPVRYPYGFPPLWGDGSFNVAAGMARLHKAAGFIKRKMPLAAGGTLSDQEAYDIADFVIHQPRPDFPGKVKDWPKGGKPDDARY